MPSARARRRGAALNWRVEGDGIHHAARASAERRIGSESAVMEGILAEDAPIYRRMGFAVSDTADSRIGDPRAEGSRPPFVSWKHFPWLEEEPLCGNANSSPPPSPPRRSVSRSPH